MIVNGCAGPAGWEEGARLLGSKERIVGFDIDDNVCRTAQAAGHERVQADISTVHLRDMSDITDGVIMSPPCQGWSPTGDQLGRFDQALVLERIEAFAAGTAPPPRCEWKDSRSHLTAEPMRWVHELQPRWVALEQVREVQPLWDFIAHILTRQGYSVWTDTIDAANYGVPQNRYRAVLLARRDGIPVQPPIATHGTTADGLFEVVEPYVSMADALGWGGATMVSNNSSGGDPRVRGRRSMDRPAFTMTGKCGRFRWEWPDDTWRTLTVAEAGQLQSFRADYPWKGGSIAQQQQVGDAVPPLLAAALLRDFLTPSAQVNKPVKSKIVT